MKKLIISVMLLNSCYIAYAQSSAEKEILSILDEQIASWNAGDLEKFMKGYWNNDSLMFVGKSGVTYGYLNTLANYKRSYPDIAAMGKLSFEILLLKKLSPEYIFVVGKWLLNRSAGDLFGHYTLLFRKIKNNWVIVTDHSS